MGTDLVCCANFIQHPQPSFKTGNEKTVTKAHLESTIKEIKAEKRFVFISYNSGFFPVLLLSLCIHYHSDSFARKRKYISSFLLNGFVTRKELYAYQHTVLFKYHCVFAFIIYLLPLIMLQIFPLQRLEITAMSVATSTSHVTPSVSSVPPSTSSVSLSTSSAEPI